MSNPPDQVADPAIVARVGDVHRPRCPMPFNPHLQHIPGRSGLLAGIQLLYGMTQQGEAYFTGEARQLGPVFRQMIGPDPIVCVADAELNLQVGTNKQQLWSSALPWAYLLGGMNRRSATVDGPLALDGIYHQEVRELLRPAFSPAAIDGYLAAAIPRFQDRFERWAQQRRVALKAAIRRLMADVAAQIFLGIQDPAEGALLDRATAHTWLAPQALWKRSRFSLSWQRAMRGYDTLWEALRPQVTARRSGAGADLFSWFCRAAGAAEQVPATESASSAAWFDDDTLVRVLISSLMAAFDTTSSGIASMAWLLARHPEWQQRLREELPSGGLSGESLRRLQAHDLVWKETLRLMPVAGQLNRQALRDTELGGFFIPAGTLVVALTGTVMWDPRYWSAPERFDPERFSVDRAEHRRTPGAYLPFGAGPHTCIGAQLAALEATAFFATLLRRYRLVALAAGDPGHWYRPFGIVGGSLPMRLEPL